MLYETKKKKKAPRNKKSTDLGTYFYEGNEIRHGENDLFGGHHVVAMETRRAGSWRATDGGTFIGALAADDRAQSRSSGSTRRSVVCRRVLPCCEVSCLPCPILFDIDCYRKHTVSGLEKTFSFVGAIFHRVRKQ